MKDLSEYVGYKFKKGSKIHIKKSHEGLFTKKAQAAGMSPQEYASHVLANKDNYDSATVRQAVFCKNAASWKHEEGGTITPVLQRGGSTANSLGNRFWYFIGNLVDRPKKGTIPQPPMTPERKAFLDSMVHMDSLYKEQLPKIWNTPEYIEDQDRDSLLEWDPEDFKDAFGSYPEWYNPVTKEINFDYGEKKLQK